jgi:hypothetical protein
MVLVKPRVRTSGSGTKAKVTLTIDRAIHEEAKEIAANRKPKVGLSNLVETYLTFLVDAPAWCFVCSYEFTVSKAMKCKICNFMKCPECEACGCRLKQKETVVAVRNMRRVYKYLGAEVDE